MKAVQSFDSNVPSSFNDSRGGPDGSGGKSIPVDSIRRCVGVILVRLILQTCKREGHWYFDFVYIRNSMCLCD